MTLENERKQATAGVGFLVGVGDRGNNLRWGKDPTKEQSETWRRIRPKEQ